MQGRTQSAAVDVREVERERRVGLVGCGRIAGRHLEAILALRPQLRLVGAVDPAPDARDRVALAAGVPGYETLEELLSAQEVDLVALCSPSGLHPEQATLAARAGADVLTEKPLGVRLGEARAMVQAVQDLGRELFIVKQLRYHPLFLAVRDALQLGRFGRLYTVALQVFWSRPQAYYDQAAWRGTRELDGGALMNQASHYVDLLEWLFGPVARVQGLGATLGRAIEVEDTAALHLEWAEGLLGSMHVTMLTYPQNLTTSLTVIGERGTVRLGGRGCDEIEAWTFAEPLPQDEAVNGLAEVVGVTLSKGHEQVYRDVLRGDCARGYEGLLSLAVIDAAHRSFARGGLQEVTTWSRDSRSVGP